ncbi:hypothetical protein H6F53_13305 [Trichocoleus sp. FACHB-832]|uniref:hypothetical protein n=1 Tax=Trichocoleus sp. FACHB-832 TaxID=2692875 RepID=UPI0016823E1A|nr:hypothetical protein [Trichocoleus sp. FACHB-832]MBD1906455.1 hypothetical protein [Trichocoleus sp. FACHB-832]
MYEAFIDLDELIVRCRDKLAKKLIQEAVACYRCGAYRSCIVATWNAVVFDFLHKLRELEVSGNKEATTILENFEQISSQEKFKELWQFESDIPEIALKKFELISPVEKSDIERLFKDRSRCAHPSMTSLEEPFEATAELARYHLRSAIMHSLQRPPVQGRSALKRIWQEIKSEYFPKDSESATQFFQKSLLASARPALIKDVVIGLTVNLLTEEHLEDERLRQFSALNAIAKMYHSQVKEILEKHLSNIILDKVTDSNWDKVIIYLGTVQIWDTLSEPCQLKAVAFIDKLKIFDRSRKNNSICQKDVNVLLKAARLGFLKESVNNKLQLPLKEMLLLKDCCRNQLKDSSIDGLIKPLLEEKIPQANFDELLSMYLDEDSLLNEKIKPYLEEKIAEPSLENLIGLLEENLEKDKFLEELIERSLQAKINEASLDKLLEARQLVSWYPLKHKTRFEDLIQTALIKYVQDIVDRFRQSSSYRNAENNAEPLVYVFDYLSDTQWETILEEFWNNNQIYRANNCPITFSLLFKKSVALNGSVQPYWLPFRKKLNKYCDNLKLNFPDDAPSSSEELNSLINSHCLEKQ